MKKLLLFGLVSLSVLSCTSTPKWTETQKDGYVLITQKGGQTLGYSKESGIDILTVDRYAFKDLNGNGSLDVYEDWRRSFEDRAADLASQLSIEEIAGLMLYSGHQALPMPAWWGHYDGKWFEESGADPWDLTDEQKKFLAEDNLRHVLFAAIRSTEVAVKWKKQDQS